MTAKPSSPQNLLYYGDNLPVLRQHLPDESVDLIYLDPPFNSNADYNVLFTERDGTQAHAQFKAFGDTWTWDTEAAANFQDGIQNGGDRVAKCLMAFRTFLGTNDVLAYLSMMAPRLVELRRVLKPTGSIYLHCDPTASHYLKMLMDAVFRPENFLNDISWKRTFAHGSARRYGPVHDTLLFYAKSDAYRWTGVRSPQAPAYIEKHFKLTDGPSGKRFQAISLTGAGVRRGESGQPWRGINPTTVGRHWALPGNILGGAARPARSVQESLDALDSMGRIYWPKKTGGTPRLKWFIDDAAGAAIPDMWTDVPPISAHAAERLGYPTQKPEALLERIIQASSNEGDVVLDPFCGCGTAVAVAQRLNRRWVGIDITHLAINLIKVRLRDTFGPAIEKTYRVVGEPTTLPDARQLAREDPYQFQWWALGLVGARPAEQKKGADKGIDGRLFFHDDNAAADVKQVILSVKAGENLNVAMVRDLVGVLDREKTQGAAIGVVISMEEPTKPMRQEAAGAGFYRSPAGTQHPRVQILTVGQLLEGKRIDMPPWRDLRTFKKAPRAQSGKKNQTSLPFDGQ